MKQMLLMKDVILRQQQALESMKGSDNSLPREPSAPAALWHLYIACFFEYDILV